MNTLYSSKVPRSLEAKTKLFGFELADALLVFFYLALSNLIFGQTSLKFPLVWGGSLALGLGVYLLKRGKPDNYIQHLFQYALLPSIFSAGRPDTEAVPYPPTGGINNEKAQK